VRDHQHGGARSPVDQNKTLVSRVCTDIRLCKISVLHTPNFLEGYAFFFCCYWVLSVDYRFCIERYDLSRSSLLVRCCNMMGLMAAQVKVGLRQILGSHSMPEFAPPPRTSRDESKV